MIGIVADGVVAFGTAFGAVDPAGTRFEADLEPFFALLAAIRAVAAPETIQVLDPTAGETKVGQFGVTGK